MRVLPNAGGEDQRFNAADGSGQCANFAAHAKGEVIQSGFGGLSPGGFNSAHILRYAGHALQATIVIQKMRDIR